MIFSSNIVWGTGAHVNVEWGPGARIMNRCEKKMHLKKHGADLFEICPAFFILFIFFPTVSVILRKISHFTQLSEVSVNGDVDEYGASHVLLLVSPTANRVTTHLQFSIP